MEEPYRTLQEIGQASEQLAANPQAPPDKKFAECHKQLNRLTEIKLARHSLPVDWEQYIAGVEVTLQRIQAESRPQVDRHQAAQIALQSQAELNRDKDHAKEAYRSQRRARKQKLKLTVRKTSAVALILLIVGIIGAYQWSVISGDEGWFHDISKKRWQVIEKRVSFGKSIETKDHLGMTGFLYLAKTGTFDDLKQMQRLGADIHAKDNAGRTALHHAAASANLESVKWLISQGMNVNTTDHTGTTPLHYFFQKASGTTYALQTLAYLLSQGAKTDTANGEESLLMAAVLWVRGGSFDEKPATILQKLINLGADVNHRGINGATALKNALVKYLPQSPNPITLLDSDPVIKLLLDSGAVYEKEDLFIDEGAGLDAPDRIKFNPGL